MDLNKTVAEGLLKIARAAGDTDPATALKAAKVAAAATQAAGTFRDVARMAGDAMRDAIEKHEQHTSAAPPPVPQEPMDEAATQAQARPEAGGLQALLASARAAYRSELVSAGVDPDSPNEVLVKASQLVRDSLPAVIGKTGALVDMATPTGSDAFQRWTRIVLKRATAADVAAEAENVETWTGWFKGTGKTAFLGFLVSRMAKADPAVLTALDAFSNHNAERNSALTTILESKRCRGMHVDAETAIATLKGFQLTNGKPDYIQRKIALGALAGKLGRDERPRVIEGFSDDDKHRLDALRVVAKLYDDGSMPAVEMVELLKLFGRTTRDTARGIVDEKLSDRENVQLIDDLFEPKKRISDLPEIKRLKDQLGGLMSGFAKGLQK